MAEKTETNLEDENPFISTRNLKRALKEEKTTQKRCIEHFQSFSHVH
jgi:hypothetical protein